MIELVQDLIGVPYQLGARLDSSSSASGSSRATDCFGLVVECCRRMGRPIPDPFVSAEAPMDAKRWIAERLRGWVPCHHPTAGGVVELRSGEQPAHIGFLLNDRDFLHSTKKTGAVIGRLDRRPWHGRIVGFYVYGQ